MTYNRRDNLGRFTKTETEHKRNCPSCGEEQTYSRADGLLRAIREDRVCFRCTMNNRNKARARTYSKQSKKYVVYHLPAEYYVGMTKKYSDRMADHDRTGRDITDCHIISEHDTAQEATLAEAEWHSKGYYGCIGQDKSEELKRELYANT